MKKLQRFYEKIEKNKLTKLIPIAVALEWIEQHAPEFVKKVELPPNSREIEPLDYHVWGKILERYKVFISKRLGALHPQWKAKKILMPPPGEIICQICAVVVCQVIYEK